MANESKDCLSALRRWVIGWRMAVKQCQHKREKALLALASAGISALALRGLVGALAVIAPAETWAGEFSREVVKLSGPHFWLSLGFGTAGGVASLFHELRQKPGRFSLMSAIGHMFISQFSGLLAFVGAVSAEWMLPLALGACGLAGWGGAATLTKVSMLVERKLAVLLGVGGADDRN